MRIKRIKAALLTVLVFSVSAMAQQPSPCAEVESRASMLGSRVAAERVLVQTCRARLDSLEQELAKQKSQINDTTQQRVAEEQKAALLADSLSEARQQIADLEKLLIERTKTIIAKDETIATLIAERGAALNKATKANKRTWIAIIAAAIAGIAGIAK